MPGAASQIGPAATSPNPFPNGKHLHSVHGGLTVPAREAALLASKLVSEPVTTLGNACGVLNFEPRLGLVNSHRVLACVEKAMERLQLLALLSNCKPKNGLTVPSPPEATSIRMDLGYSTHAAESVDGAATFAQRLRQAIQKSRQTFAEPGEIECESTTPLSRPGSSAKPRAENPVDIVALDRELEFDQMGDNGVGRLLFEQRSLEKRYHELVERMKPMRVNPLDPQLDPQCYAHVRDPGLQACEEELQIVSRQLRENNKNLVVLLSEDPNETDNWDKVMSERDELYRLLSSFVSELMSGYTFGVHESTRLDGQRRASGTLTGTDASAVINHTDEAIIFPGDRNAVPSGGQARDDASDTAGDLVPELESQLGKIERPTASTTGSVSALQGISFHSLAAASLPSLHDRQRQLGSASPLGAKIPLTSCYSTFASKVLDELEAQNWADGLIRKEKEMNQNVKQLQADIRNERSQKEQELATRNRRLAELKRAMQDLKLELKMQMEELRGEMRANLQGDTRVAGEVARQVLHDVHSKENLLQEEGVAHALFSSYLKTRTQQLEDQALLWEEKNQREIKKKEVRRLDLENSRKHCADRLRDLLEAKEIAEKLHKEREEETKRRESLESAKRQQKHNEYVAASKLQSALKGMLTRHALEALKKKRLKKSKSKA